MHIKPIIWPLMALALVIGTIILTPSNPTQAARNFTCNMAAPFIQVNPITRPIKYVRNVSAQTLTHDNQHAVGHGHFIGGTGGGTIALETDVRYETQTMGTRGCLRIKSIRGTFYAEPVIHVASNFARGSCEYEAILEHERKHIKAMKYFHKRHAPKIKQEIRQLANYLQPKDIMPANQIQAIQNQIHVSITKHITAYSNEIMEKLAKRQDQIDTPEEYARVAAKCDGWGRANINLPKR